MKMKMAFRFEDIERTGLDMHLVKLIAIGERLLEF